MTELKGGGVQAAVTLEPNRKRTTRLCGLEEKPLFIDQLCVDQTPSRGKRQLLEKKKGGGDWGFSVCVCVCVS